MMNLSMLEANMNAVERVKHFSDKEVHRPAEGAAPRSNARRGLNALRFERVG